MQLRDQATNLLRALHVAREEDRAPDPPGGDLRRQVPGQLGPGEAGEEELSRVPGAHTVRRLTGIARGRVVFVVPGSRGAVRLALEKLVLPELGHLAAEATKTR